MLGRSIARVSRSSNPYVCFSCQTKQLSVHQQTLLYTTTSQSNNDHADLPISLAGNKSPPSASSPPSNNSTPPADSPGDSKKKGGRRRPVNQDFWSATLNSLKRTEKRKTEEKERPQAEEKKAKEKERPQAEEKKAKEKEKSQAGEGKSKKDKLRANEKAEGKENLRTGEKKAKEGENSQAEENKAKAKEKLRAEGKKAKVKENLQAKEKIGSDQQSNQTADTLESPRKKRRRLSSERRNRLKRAIEYRGKNRAQEEEAARNAEDQQNIPSQSTESKPPQEASSKSKNVRNEASKSGGQPASSELAETPLSQGTEAMVPLREHIARDFRSLSYEPPIDPQHTAIPKIRSDSRLLNRRGRLPPTKLKSRLPADQTVSGRRLPGNLSMRAPPDLTAPLVPKKIVPKRLPSILKVGRVRSKSKVRRTLSAKGVRLVLSLPEEVRPVQSTERSPITQGQTQPVTKLVTDTLSQIQAKDTLAPRTKTKPIANVSGFSSLKEALTGPVGARRGPMDIKRLSPDDLHFNPVDVKIPPVPTLAHGLDRVLFNPGVYHLQDPRSRVYNFDPYLEKIMPATEFDFDALEKYMTSSKDQGLIDIAKSLNAKFTGSTSSMSGVLTHFHYLLSQWRRLNLSMLSKDFPISSDRFSKIQRAPSAIFLRWKDGTYAIDADKEFDTPNIMSWLGQSMEKLLTNSVDQFERYRRSNTQETPADDDGKCFHYTQQGNVLMRSQLDAKDPRLPGTGIFDLKTRAVVSVRMESSEFKQHSGYQIRNLRGEWESFEREYYDMIRATMLKYSLQVRMGRMDGIFIAFHNVERIFGFQYVSKVEMDLALHGQEDPCLGDQEFKLSVELLSEILDKAAKRFPEQSIRLHFETRDVQVPFMYIFAEPVSEEQVEAIQNKNSEIVKDFERSVVGLGREEEEMQKEWGDINTRVEKELEEDQEGKEDVEDEERTATPRDEAEELEDGEEKAIEEDLIADDVAEPEEEAENDTMKEAKTLIQSLEESLPEPTDDNVLGLTLTIRNRVDGTYISRPENLTPDEEWSIEYSLSEIPRENGRAVRLLEQLKSRRMKLMVKEELEEKATDYYRNVLSEYSKKGREWRDKMDQNDRERETQVYTPLGMDREEVVARMGPWGRIGAGKEFAVPEQELDVEVGNAEDYMEWLYHNMGTGNGRDA